MKYTTLKSFVVGVGHVASQGEMIDIDPYIAAQLLQAGLIVPYEEAPAQREIVTPERGRKAKRDR
jgi:hypothetical protein